MKRMITVIISIVLLSGIIIGAISCFKKKDDISPKGKDSYRPAGKFGG